MNVEYKIRTTLHDDLQSSSNVVTYVLNCVKLDINPQPLTFVTGHPDAHNSWICHTVCSGSLSFWIIAV